MQMTEKVLTYEIDDIAGGEFYVDLAESMSILNRRLERQQGLWKVDAVCIYVMDHASGAGVPFQFAISGAPRNWVTRNSLVKIFELWKDQQQKAYDSVSPSVKPKWNDFKVFLNENHRVTGTITPVSGHMFGGIDPYIAGEWIHSRIVTVTDDGAGHLDTEEPLVKILGPTDSNAVASIREYQISRARPFSPDPAMPAVSESIYAEASGSLGEQVIEILDNMEGQNDDPPYDVLNYPGGASNGTEPMLYAFATNTNTLGRKIVLNGFSAPNGVIECQVDGGLEGQNIDVWMQIFVSGREAY